MLWRRELAPLVSLLKDDDCRILQMTLKMKSQILLFMNTYLPYQSIDNHDLYLDYLGRLAARMDEAETSRILIIGDFNASSGTTFARELDEWCSEHLMTISDQQFLGPDTFTYVSEAHGVTSWLDHVITSADAHSMIDGARVLDLPPSSDHRPLSININVRDQLVEPPNHLSTQRRTSSGYKWDRANVGDLNRYRQLTSDALMSISLPREALACPDVKCSNEQHRRDIDDFYDAICDSLLSASERTLCRQSSDGGGRHVIPGWNEHVRDLHADARTAFLLWRNCGKPRQVQLSTT